MLTRSLAVVAALAAVPLAAACGSSTPAAPPPITWLADDLLSEGGRFYVTCEDSTNERREREVWLSPEQAADHVEDAPCPAGEEKRGAFLEPPDAETKVKAVPKPTKPVTAATKAPVPTTTTVAPPARGATTSATPRRATTSASR